MRRKKKEGNMTTITFDIKVDISGEDKKIFEDLLKEAFDNEYHVNRILKLQNRSLDAVCDKAQELKSIPEYGPGDEKQPETQTYSDDPLETCDGEMECPICISNKEKVGEYSTGPSLGESEQKNSYIYKFKIGSIFRVHKEEYISRSIRVCKSDGIISPYTIVSPYKEITIKFDYPLEHEVELKFKSDKNDFTRLEFWKCIHDGYTQIYKEETDAVGDPGRICDQDNEKGDHNNLINRASSTGPHGIWGHYITDLFIESVLEIKPSVYKLNMGS